MTIKARLKQTTPPNALDSFPAIWVDEESAFLITGTSTEHMDVFVGTCIAHVDRPFYEKHSYKRVVGAFYDDLYMPSLHRLEGVLELSNE